MNSGRSVKEVGEEYSLNGSMLRRWRKEERERSYNKVRPGDEAVKIKELEAELKDVRMERDILKKAVAKTDQMMPLISVLQYQVFRFKLCHQPYEF